jgi:hypothetical protein
MGDHLIWNGDHDEQIQRYLYVKYGYVAGNVASQLASVIYRSSGVHKGASANALKYILRQSLAYHMYLLCRYSMLYGVRWAVLLHAYE